MDRGGVCLGDGIVREFVCTIFQGCPDTGVLIISGICGIGLLGIEIVQEGLDRHWFALVELPVIGEKGSCAFKKREVSGYAVS